MDQNIIFNFASFYIILLVGTPEHEYVYRLASLFSAPCSPVHTPGPWSQPVHELWPWIPILDGRRESDGGQVEGTCCTPSGAGPCLDSCGHACQCVCECTSESLQPT